MDENRSLTTASSVGAKQFIVINIGIEQFGIDIKYVDNIVRMQKITRVPKVQNYFRGVINLRGEIIPVMSIRRKFGLEEDEITDKTRIVILKPEGMDSIGIIIDSVKEVITLHEENIENRKYDSKDDKTKYINGIGKHADNLISLLNISGIVSENI